MDSPAISDANVEPNGELLFHSYRVRLLNGADVPILNRCPQWSDQQILIVDLPDNVDQSDPYAGDNDENKENEDTKDGSIEMAGSPLKFEFLTLDKLIENNGSIPIGRRLYGRFQTNDSPFQINPLPAKKAFGLRQILYNLGATALSPSLASKPLFVSSDATDSMRSFFLGVTRTEKAVITHLCVCIGSTDSEGLDRAARELNRVPSSLDERSSAQIVINLISNELDPDNQCRAFSTLTITHEAHRTHIGVRDRSFPPNAKATLQFHPGWMDKRIPYHQRTVELNSILQLACALKKQGQVEFATSSLTEEEMLGQIKRLIVECKDITMLPGERFFDFTERLWDILKSVSSYRMLVTGLKTVFDALRQGNINTMLHNDNLCHLASLIRLSNEGGGANLHLPRLEALAPIEILLQIGVEKFRRDTLHLLVSEKYISSENDITTFLRRSGTATADEEAIALVPFHFALQTMAHLRTVLNASDNDLFVHTKQVIAKYVRSHDDFFQMSVPVVKVKKELLAGFLPMEYSTTSTYTTKGGEMAAMTQLLLSRLPSLPYLERFNRGSEDRWESFLATMMTSSYVSMNFFPQ